MRERRLSSPRGIWRNPYYSDKVVHATREHHLFNCSTFLIAKFSGYFEIANALLLYYNMYIVFSFFYSSVLFKLVYLLGNKALSACYFFANIRHSHHTTKQSTTFLCLCDDEIINWYCLQSDYRDIYVSSLQAPHVSTIIIKR